MSLEGHHYILPTLKKKKKSHIIVGKYVISDAAIPLVLFLEEAVFLNKSVQRMIQ